MAGLTEFFALLDGVRDTTPDDAEFLFDAADPAGARRRRNLERYLAAGLDRGAAVLLVAEAPGYRGMTITGVPFTSVRELGDGYEAPPDPAHGWELSASVVQKAFRAWPGPAPVAWSICPNHPFRAGDPATNRAPRPAEVRAGAPVALELIRALGAEVVVAVGRKAQGALATAGVDAVPVRHPAQGGAGIFAAQMAALGASLR